MFINILLTIILGAYSLISQVIFLRELGIIFYGNEFSLGIILFLWLFLTGIGAFFGAQQLRKTNEPNNITRYTYYVIAQTLFLALAFAGIHTIKKLYNLSTGELPPLSCMFTASAMIITANACIQGMIFPFMCQLWAPVKNTRTTLFASLVNHVYIIESVGACLGGIYFAYLGVHYFSPLTTIALLNILYMAALCLLLISHKQKRLIVSALATLVLHIGICLYAAPIENILIQKLYAPLAPSAYCNSEYGQTVIVHDNDNNFAVYTNGILTDETGNDYASEEQFYYARLQDEKTPARILLLDGGLCLTAYTMLSTHPENITIIFPDRKACSLIMEQLPADVLQALTEKSIIICAPIRSFIRHTSERYDLIISATSPPYTLGLNQFYTQEFFSKINGILSPEGIFSTTLPAAENLIDNELAAFLSCIYHTAATVFNQVAIIPGNNAVFIMSNRSEPLTNNATLLSNRARRLNPIPKFINNDYLPTRLAPERIAYIHRRIAENIFPAINHDLRPIAFYFDLILWSQKTSTSLKALLKTLYTDKQYLLTLIIVLILAISTVLSHKKNDTARLFFATSTLGFSEIAIEIIIILTYQAFFGNIYASLSLLIALYMGGLISGSIIMQYIYTKKITLYKRLVIIMCNLVMGLYCLGICWYLQAYSSLPLFLQKSLFLYVILYGAGMLGGIQFIGINTAYIGTTHAEDRKGSTTYCIDMLGSAFGAICASIILVPLYGIPVTLGILAFLNICAGIILIKKLS